MKPVTFQSIFESENRALSGIVRQLGAKAGQLYVKAFLTTAIIDLVEFFNVGKSMGEQQVIDTVELVAEEYWMLKPDDFKLCFNQVKKGKFGKVYDRIDGQVIMSWLSDYYRRRTDYAESKSYQEYSRYQAEYRNSQYDREIIGMQQLEAISRIKSDRLRNQTNQTDQAKEL